jgi:fluoroacetyl-CoA thioesterase
MRSTLKPGVTYRHDYLVPSSKTVPHLFPDAPEIASMPAVLATPYLVAIIEWACTRCLNEHLDIGEGSLGVHVNVSHLAATLPGQTVRIDIDVAKVEGPRVSFRVSAHDGVDKIGEGTHDRVVVPTERFKARVNQKAVKVGSKQLE